MKTNEVNVTNLLSAENNTLDFITEESNFSTIGKQSSHAIIRLQGKTLFFQIKNVTTEF